jgi:hypothetical protein
MSIRNFGLFWRRDEVDWTPGRGTKDGFRLLGRSGKILPGLRVADSRWQLGIYILYGNHGPYYVGLTKKGKLGLGGRLKNHTENEHKDEWDRFSWFGFRKVLDGTDTEGLQNLASMAEVEFGSPSSDITDIEALLIRAMGLRNIAQPNFKRADQWEQVKLDEVDQFMGRIAK